MSEATQPAPDVTPGATPAPQPGAQLPATVQPDGPPPATVPPVPRPERAEDRIVQPWEAVKASASMEEISQIDKAAIILSAIGPEASATFLKNMSETALTRVAIAISELDRVQPEMLDMVIAEFLMSIGTEEEVSGGSQTARRLLSEVLDDNTIEKIMFDVEGGDTRKAWKKLNDCTNVQLATFVAAEHPQTAAVIMSELRADKAAAVLERLDQEFAHQTIMRLSRVPTLDSNVAEMVERVIARDFLSAIQRTKRSRRPADLIAGLMNNLGAQAREHFLGYLDQEKPALHKEVLKTMFTFNDIRHRVEARDVAIILKEVEEPIILTALKWGRAQNNASVDFILENISKRLSERLAEDLDAMPDVTQRDGEAAHQELVRVIQEMAKTAKIQLIEDESAEE